jgi:hypothetical protein
MNIRITSTLDRNTRRRIARWARRREAFPAPGQADLVLRRDGAYHFYPSSEVLSWGTVTLAEEAHAFARHMMVAGGRTFDYELV